MGVWEREHVCLPHLSDLVEGLGILGLVWIPCSALHNTPHTRRDPTNDLSPVGLVEKVAEAGKGKSIA